jgi:iron(III) transport system ATP-binding protein
VAACQSAVNGHYRLTLDGDGWRGQCLAGERFAVGEAALLVLRPESLALAAPGTAAADGQITWPGRVANSIFRGARRSLFVDTGGRQLMVEAPAEPAVDVGAPVTLLATPADAWAVRP